MIKSLLIVTASVLTSGLLVRLLTSNASAHSIATASSTEEALQWLRQQSPTMIVADIARYTEQSFSALIALKAAAPSARIAVLIDEADSIVQRKCVSLGATWVFDKTTEFERLLDLVQTGA